MLLESGLRESSRNASKYSTVTPPRRAARCAALLLCLALAAPLGVRADAVDDAAKLYQQGNAAAALEQVDRYLADHPADARGRFLKAQLLASQGKEEEAIALYTGIIDEYPELAEPYNNLAVIYAQQGRYELARNYLERAVAAFPEYSVALENLGDVYAKFAETSYRSAARYDPNNATLQTKIAELDKLLAEKKVTPVFTAPPPPKPVGGGVKKRGTR
jgi:tetratricopeptide (TPR) repeat protein